MNRRRISFVHIIVFVVLAVAARQTVHDAQSKDGFLRIFMLDIGQGDSLFIEAPNGTQVLIDGGPDQTVVQRLGGVMPFYDHDIDVVVATHLDSDHSAGLVSVLDRYDVSVVVENGAESKTAVARAWRVAVENEHARHVIVRAGTTISLGNGVTLTALNPLEDMEGRLLAKANDYAITFLLTYREFSMIFTADIEERTERRILLAHVLVDADVLKIAHHGSRTSTSDAFLSAVSPQLALISVGARNSYGHPTAEVLNRLEKNGIPYYRTDTDGTVELASDGYTYSVRTHYP